MTELHEGLRAWPPGSFPLEAAVELLIRDDRAVYAGAPWLWHDGDLVSVDHCPPRRARGPAATRGDRCSRPSTRWI